MTPQTEVARINTVKQKTGLQMNNASWNYNTGTNVKGLSLDEMLVKADLDWQVQEYPLFTGNFGEIEIPGKKAVCRVDNDGKKTPIDIYSSRNVQSNKRIVSFFQNLLKLADLEIETLGHINSRLVYASARLPKYDMNVRKLDDITQCRIIVVDSHENNSGFRTFVHYNRVVCTNGLTQKVSQQVGIVNHSGQLNRSKARLLLQAAIKKLQEQSKVADFLAEQTMTVQDATVQLIAAFGDPDKAIDDQKPMIKTVLNLFQGEAIGSELMTAYNTAYGLLQSLTEYYSHHSQTDSQANRFQSILNGTYQKEALKFERQLVQAYAKF